MPKRKDLDSTGSARKPDARAFFCARSGDFPKIGQEPPPCPRAQLCSMLAPPAGSDPRKSMQRLTARFLLLFALVGAFLPTAFAITAAPPHACCLRKAVHQCHSSDSDQRSLRSAACCNQGCGRAVTTKHSANLRSPLLSDFAPHVSARILESPVEIPATRFSYSQSTRAPPQFPIARS
jgi:hypothetical protein